LGFFPTPVVELPHLNKALGGPQIFLKRDDLIGLAFGGTHAGLLLGKTYLNIGCRLIGALEIKAVSLTAENKVLFGHTGGVFRRHSP